MTRVAVIGGGWAGLAAAVEAVSLGADTTLFEMAPALGGRARSLEGSTPALDNGQHILIGAYVETLALMRRVGGDPEAGLLRLPLRLRYPDRETLRLPPGPPTLAFLRGVLGCSAWSWGDRLRFLAASSSWTLRGFRCDPALTVAGLCAGLPRAVRDDLIDPLCVAALNTPADQASAAVFLRVLKDALFSGPGSADLLLPRRGLSALLPTPARDWLLARGATIRTRRVQRLEAAGRAWRIDGDEEFDAVIVAASSVEAARLTRDLAPAWSAVAGAFEFQPIVTIYLESAGSALPAPMVALRESATEPAQFAFDLGQLDQQPGLFSLVVSGAAPWIERGLEATGAAALAQAERHFQWASPPRIVRVLSEKRATFACTPGLRRPEAPIAPGLWAAGDYLAGPYPATLEGAVRSGLAAARSAMRQPEAGTPPRG
ncbi:hydroxysqualene dehydroxylase HpnE [Mitsuaria sp. GD03876]|uniref:hydroxysqualene dehydroxylase HpnE n=1 Tax=Mitsuaria sp. GD03876 TaxID=2975399 RepID=UPI002446B2AF|nr:hydroxysqualene dehydroxylase HpnE [Mitsuaria sp. GD03876]MDH0864267.1 hydroxysqualene dehydroxylase HpnE [Mitsuaria sp. GD03876]